MMMSQILKLVDSSKTQKSNFFDNEAFFLQIKKVPILCIIGYNMVKNSFLVEVTSKGS